VQFPTLLNAVRGLMGKSPLGVVRFPVELENPDLKNSGAAIAAIGALRPAMELHR
jgi:hypothetical protein